MGPDARRRRRRRSGAATAGRLLALAVTLAAAAPAAVTALMVGARGRTRPVPRRAPLAAAVVGDPTVEAAREAAQVVPRDDNDGLDQLPLPEAKRRLLELLPRLRGRPEELRTVEALINRLEALHVPPQTLPFLNLALGGDWQLLFSTTLAGSSDPARFRIREQVQRVACRGAAGALTTEVTWDLAQGAEADDDDDDDKADTRGAVAPRFDVSGTLAVTSAYELTQGARLAVPPDAPPELRLQLAPGSAVPRDAPALVARLRRAMPPGLFDPSGHGLDPTYLDADLRIVRYTGPRLEGVRDVFVRRGSLVVDPGTAL